MDINFKGLTIGVPDDATDEQISKILASVASGDDIQANIDDSIATSEPEATPANSLKGDDILKSINGQNRGNQLGEAIGNASGDLVAGGMSAIQGGVGLLNDISGADNYVKNKAREAIGMDTVEAGQGIGDDLSNAAKWATGVDLKGDLTEIGDRAKKELQSEQYRTDAKEQASKKGLDIVTGYATHPDLLIGKFAESAPAMAVGIGLTSALAEKIAIQAAAEFGGLLTEAGKAAAQSALAQNAMKLIATSGAIEGLQSAGDMSYEAQQDHKAFIDYAPQAAATGLATAAIDIISGKLFGDAATDLATGTRTQSGGMLAKVGKETFSEQQEEGSQSAIETQMRNSIYKDDPSKQRSVLDSYIEGSVVGGAMGGSMGGLSSLSSRNDTQPAATLDDTITPESTSPLGETINAEESQSTPAPNDNLSNINAIIQNNIGALEHQKNTTKVIEEETGVFDDSVGVDDALITFEAVTDLTLQNHAIQSTGDAVSEHQQTQSDIRTQQAKQALADEQAKLDELNVTQSDTDKQAQDESNYIADTLAIDTILENGGTLTNQRLTSVDGQHRILTKELKAHAEAKLKQVEKARSENETKPDAQAIVDSNTIPAQDLQSVIDAQTQSKGGYNPLADTWETPSYENRVNEPVKENNDGVTPLSQASDSTVAGDGQEGVLSDEPSVVETNTNPNAPQTPDAVPVSETTKQSASNQAPLANYEEGLLSENNDGIPIKQTSDSSNLGYSNAPIVSDTNSYSGNTELAEDNKDLVIEPTIEGATAPMSHKTAVSKFKTKAFDSNDYVAVPINDKQSVIAPIEKLSFDQYAGLKENANQSRDSVVSAWEGITGKVAPIAQKEIVTEISTENTFTPTHEDSQGNPLQQITNSDGESEFIDADGMTVDDDGYIAPISKGEKDKPVTQGDVSNNNAPLVSKIENVNNQILELTKQLQNKEITQSEWHEKRNDLQSQKDELFAQYDNTVTPTPPLDTNANVPLDFTQAPILKKDGTPFQTKAAANLAINSKSRTDLSTDTHEAVELPNSGFGIVAKGNQAPTQESPAASEPTTTEQPLTGAARIRANTEKKRQERLQRDAELGIEPIVRTAPENTLESEHGVNPFYKNSSVAEIEAELPKMQKNADKLAQQGASQMNNGKRNTQKAVASEGARKLYEQIQNLNGYLDARKALENQQPAAQTSSESEGVSRGTNQFNVGETVYIEWAATGNLEPVNYRGRDGNNAIVVKDGKQMSVPYSDLVARNEPEKHYSEIILDTLVEKYGWKHSDAKGVVEKDVGGNTTEGTLNTQGTRIITASFDTDRSRYLTAYSGFDEIVQVDGRGDIAERAKEFNYKVNTWARKNAASDTVKAEPVEKSPENKQVDDNVSKNDVGIDTSSKLPKYNPEAEYLSTDKKGNVTVKKYNFESEEYKNAFHAAAKMFKNPASDNWSEARRMDSSKGFKDGAKSLGFNSMDDYYSHVRNKADDAAKKREEEDLKRSTKSDIELSLDKDYTSIKSKKDDALIRKYRQTVLDAEAVAEEAINNDDASLFDKYADLYQHTAKFINEKINRSKQAPAKSDAMTEIDAELDDLLGEAGAIILNRLSMKAVPEANVDLLPVMSKIMGLLAKKGYLTFKENAKQVLTLMRHKFGDKITDAIDIEDLQGGYIAMSRHHEGTTHKRDVVMFESIDELYQGEANNAEQVKENSTEKTGASFPANETTGSTVTIATPSNEKEFEATYEVAEIGDITASHDMNNRINDKFNDDKLQGRDRTHVDYEVKTQDQIKNFNPKFLGSSVASDDGAPIITNESSKVISGNGRHILLSRLYNRYPEKAAQYKQWLMDNAQSFGLDADVIAKMDKPILVRRKSNDDDLELIADKSNVSGMAEMSALDRAFSDARQVNESVFLKFKGGEIESFANQDFVQAFNEALNLGGSLTATSLTRMKNAIMAHAYGDYGSAKGRSIVEGLSEELKPDAKSILNALFDSSSEWVLLRAAFIATGTKDFTNHLVDAVHLIRDARANGKEVKDMVDQYDMETMSSTDPFTRQFVQLFFKDANMKTMIAQKDIAAILKDVATSMTKQISNRDMFDDTKPLTPKQILENAYAKYKESKSQPKGQSGIFDAGFSPFATRGDKRREAERREKDAGQGADSASVTDEGREIKATLRPVKDFLYYENELKQAEDRQNKENELIEITKEKGVSMQDKIARLSEKMNWSQQQAEIMFDQIAFKTDLFLKSSNEAIAKAKKGIRKALEEIENDSDAKREFEALKGNKNAPNTSESKDEGREVAASTGLPQPKLSSDEIAKYLADSARGDNGIQYSKNKDGTVDLKVNGTHVATIDHIPQYADDAARQVLKNYKAALDSEGKTLPSNPEDMTRDQFLIANKFGDLIQDFETDGSDIISNPDGTLGIDYDALYDRIQDQKKGNSNTPSTNTESLTEEEYLAKNGYPFMGYSEPALHHNRAKGKDAHSKNVDRMSQQATEYNAKREELRKEYQAKLASGEIRQPSRNEDLIRQANGHPDNESTQAARRLLDKKGIKYSKEQNENDDPVWTYSLNRYAKEKHGITRRAGFDLDMSSAQAATLSESAKRARLNKNANSTLKTSNDLKVIENEWKQAIWNSYKRSEFSLSDVYNSQYESDGFDDNNAFYVVLDKLSENGIKVGSPFSYNKMDEADRKEAFSSLDKKAQDSKGGIKFSISSTTNDFVLPVRIAETFSQARDAVKEFQGKEIKNEKTGMTATLSRNNIDKMLSNKAVKKSESTQGHALAVANTDVLFEKAILGWSKPDRDANTNIVAIHRFFSSFDVDGNARLVKLTVKEFKSEEQGSKIYSLESIEIDENTPIAQWVDATVQEDNLDPTSIRSIEDVKILADKIQNFNNVKFSYAGQRARNADQSALADAVEMEQQGVDNETIRKETGWFLGLDDRWRFEISDEISSLKPALKSLTGDVKGKAEIASVDYLKRDNGTYDITLNPVNPQLTSDFIHFIGVSRSVAESVLPKDVVSSIDKNEGDESYIGDFDDAKNIKSNFEFDGFNALPLSEVIDHPLLFRSYPSLRHNAYVQVDKSMRLDNASMYKNGDGEYVITLPRVGTNEQKLSALIHEIQHAIQRIEGFARGGDTSEFEINDIEKDVYQKTLDQHMNYLSAYVKDLLEQRKNGEISTDDVKRLSAEEAKRLNIPEYEKIIKNSSDPFKAYQRLAGEIEARDTQSRMNLTDEQRKQQTPYVSQGISKEDAIVRFGDGVANSETVDTHTTQSFMSTAKSALDAKFGKGWFDRLWGTGSFEAISNDEALRMVGDDAKFHKVWHGSKHNHDKFELSKIGTGEGEQAFGYGLYFADFRAVAEFYQEDGGAMYEVELAPKQDEYISFENSLDEQSDFVKSKLKGTAIGETLEKAGKWSELWWWFNDSEANEMPDFGLSKNDYYERKEALSKYLLSLGIRGIKYIDGYDRVSDKRNTSYVIFDDNDITIEAKYSKDGKIEAFYNPADDKVYFVPENISKDTDLAYLFAHEIGVHMMQMGENQAGFDAILKEVETLVKTKDPHAVKGRADAVKAGTKDAHLNEETLAYMIKHAPQLSVVKKFIAWFRKGLRNWGLTHFKGEAKSRWLSWETKLTSDDVSYVAYAALKRAPENVVFKGSANDNSGFLASFTPEQRERLKNLGKKKTDVQTNEIDKAYFDAVNSGDLELAKRMVLDAAEKAGVPIIDDSNVEAYEVRRKAPPKNTTVAYKLFRTKAKSKGDIFALFVSAKDPLPQGIWLDAKAGKPAADSKTGNPKVKSKLGDLAYRPGWHAGDIPLATHIGSRDESGKVAFRKDDEVWAEVEMADDVNYQDEADKNGINKKGEFIVANADIKYMPTDGLYRYKTNPDMTGKWIISGSMKINRILSEDEVNEILERNNAKTMNWSVQDKKTKSWHPSKLDLGKWGLTNNPAQNQKKLLDVITYDDNGDIVPLSKRFDTTNNDIRFSKTISSLITWSKERIDSLMREYAYNSDDAKTKAFAGFVSPDDFLSATTTPDLLKEIESESTDLDLEQLAKEAQPIVLYGTLNGNTFEIESHEGRHRMVALKKAGIKSVPVVFNIGYTAKSLGDMGSINVVGQEFNDTNGKDFKLNDATPLNWNSNQKLRDEFQAKGNDIKFSKSLTPANGGNGGRNNNDNATFESADENNPRYNKAKPVDQSVKDDLENVPREQREEVQDWLMKWANQFKPVKATTDYLNGKVSSLITTMGTLPDRDNYLVKRYQTLGRLDTVDDLVNRVFNTISKASKEDSAAIYEYMTTKDASPNFIQDQTLREAAVNLKDVITTLGEKMVEKGLIPRESYEANKGAYLPRVYLKHFMGDDSFGLFKGAGSGKSLSDLGYTKKRKDIPEEVRRLWLMEVKNPAYLASRSISVTMRDIAMMNFFDSIADNKQWVWNQSLVTLELDLNTNMPTAIFDADGNIDYQKTNSGLGSDKGKTTTRKVTPYFLLKESERMREQSNSAPAEDKQDIRDLADMLENVAKKHIADMGNEGLPQDFIKMPDSARYGALRGLVIHKQIYDDIVGTLNTFSDDKSTAEKWLGDNGILTRYVSLWKWTHVAVNIPTQVTNFLSNPMLLHMSGVRFDQVPLRMIQALKEIVNDGEHYQILKEYGGRKASFSNQELRQITQWLIEQEAEKGVGAWNKLAEAGMKIVYMAGSGVDAVSNLHQFMETWSKTAKVIDEMAKGATKENAALAAHDALFDYSLVSRNTKYLRNNPFGIPFVTWLVKSTEATAKTFVNRPTKFLPYYTLFFILSALSASANDVDDDDLDKLQKLLPEWMQEKGHAYFLPWRDEKGRWQAIDFAKFLPWGTQYELLHEAKNLVIDGKPEAVGKEMQTMGLFGSPILSIITAIKTGIDPFTRKPLVAPNSTPAEAVGSWLRYAYNLSMPPMLGMNESSLASTLLNSGELDKHGDPKKTTMQAVAKIAGLNISSIDPVIQRAEQIERRKNQITALKSRRSHELKNPNLTFDEKKEITNDYNEKIKRAMKDMQDFSSETKVSANAMRRR